MTVLQFIWQFDNSSLAMCGIFYCGVVSCLQAYDLLRPAFKRASKVINFLPKLHFPLVDSWNLFIRYFCIWFCGFCFRICYFIKLMICFKRLILSWFWEFCPLPALRSYMYFQHACYCWLHNFPATRQFTLFVKQCCGVHMIDCIFLLFSELISSFDAIHNN